MKLSELVEIVTNKRKELNKEVLEKEIKELYSQLTTLRKSLEEIRERKRKIIECKDEVKDLIQGIIKSNDVSSIVTMSEILVKRVDDCWLKREEDRKRKIEELRKKVKDINDKLLTYKKIFRNILNEDVKVVLLDEKSEDLESEIRKGEEQLKDLINKLKEKVGNNLDFLVKLTMEGEIEIDNSNVSQVVNLIEFLVSRGVNLRLKL